ncbi:efflux RND transporter periplasmic adaptor subunit [Flavobacterium ajazii]|uniref:efflux RND transporter periplasmic adaptor subunit n=1 Tax=Flavobacterium ajazii TaxID=2692318 RepID=UPI0013D793E6|nr:efflux RND transporter periplasmic adaptor subunit [Flavobacterium ajazii]
MKKNTNVILIVLTVTVAMTLIAFKLNSNKEEQKARVYQPDSSTKAIIQAEKVKESGFIETAPFVGSFIPSRKVTISTETSGKVIAVFIKEGSTVGTGTIIARLDDGVLQAQLRSARASFNLASNTLDRYEAAPSGVTQLQIENAKAQKLTNQAQIDQLIKQISFCVIRSPFSGVISSKNIELGAIVSIGTPLATLIDINSLELEINVPERHLSKFKDNMNLKVKSDVYSDAIFNGKVNFIGSQADESHNYTVKILVSNNNKTPLKAGMYGNVTVNNSVTNEAISIPRSALTGDSSNPKIYVVENGVANLRNIKVGFSNETSVQVISGLAQGETVVTGGIVNLTNGSKVEIK